MAYSQSTMVQGPSAGATGGSTVYTYKSSDNLAAVVTAGYFARNPRFTFLVDDLIFCQLGDGYAELTVTAEDSAVSV
jgi:hypothetical protein